MSPEEVWLLAHDPENGARLVAELVRQIREGRRWGREPSGRKVEDDG